MFKKVLLAMLIVAFLLAPSSLVIAQGRYGLQSVKVETTTALVLPAKTWVYGITLYADASSSYAGIHNAATIAAVVADVSGTFFDDIGEATHYDDTTHWYPEPIYCVDGVTVFIDTGILVVYYGPEPTE